MKPPKVEHRIFTIAWHIVYEMATGVHTYSACDCGRVQTRSGMCWMCWADQFKDAYAKPIKNKKSLNKS